MPNRLASEIRRVREGTSAVSITLLGLVLVPFFIAAGPTAWGKGRALAARPIARLTCIAAFVVAAWSAAILVAFTASAVTTAIMFPALVAFSIALAALAGRVVGVKTSQAVADGTRSPAPPGALAGVPGFRSLSDSQLRDVSTVGVLRQVPPGWRSTAPATRRQRVLYTVLKGEMQVTFGAGRSVKRIDVAGKGDSFPLEPLIGVVPPIASARALTDATIWEANIADLRRLLRSRSDIAVRVFDDIAETLGARYRRATDTFRYAADRFS